MAASLTTLLRKDTRFEWTLDCSTAFSKLKQAIMSSPVLRHNDPDAPIALHTDPSGEGLGAVLAQQDLNDSMERVVVTAGGTLAKAERNPSTTEKECPALIWAVGKFSPYPCGPTFDIVTDHHSLCWLTSLEDLSGRLRRCPSSTPMRALPSP